MEHVLTLDCPETRGIVHAVSGFLLEQGCDILESKQFDSQRTTATSSCGSTSRPPATHDHRWTRSGTAFVPVAEKFGMQLASCGRTGPNAGS